jgi:hypothetical protein
MQLPHHDLDLALSSLPSEDAVHYRYTCIKMFLDYHRDSIIVLHFYHGEYYERLRSLLMVVSEVLGGPLTKFNSIKTKMLQGKSYQRLLKSYETKFNEEAPLARALEDFSGLTFSSVEDLVNKWRDRVEEASRMSSGNQVKGPSLINRTVSFIDRSLGRLPKILKLPYLLLTHTQTRVERHDFVNNEHIFDRTLANVKNLFIGDSVCEAYLKKISEIKTIDRQDVYPFVFFIAPSGSGKTTFCLNLCCREEYPAIYAIFRPLVLSSDRLVQDVYKPFFSLWSFSRPE